MDATTDEVESILNCDTLYRAAQLVGALELADAASRLEIGSRAADWASIAPRTADVVTATTRLRLYLEARHGS